MSITIPGWVVASAVVSVVWFFAVRAILRAVERRYWTTLETRPRRGAGPPRPSCWAGCLDRRRRRSRRGASQVKPSAALKAQVAAAVLDAARWDVDQAITNHFGERVWLGPSFNKAGNANRDYGLLPG